MERNKGTPTPGPMRDILPEDGRLDMVCSFSSALAWAAAGTGRPRTGGFFSFESSFRWGYFSSRDSDIVTRTTDAGSNSCKQSEIKINLTFTLIHLIYLEMKYKHLDKVCLKTICFNEKCHDANFTIQIFVYFPMMLRPRMMTKRWVN